MFGVASQVVSSASNFTLGVVVGRFAGPSDLGAFGTAFVFWVIALVLYTALVTDPMVLLESDLGGGGGDGESIQRAARSALTVSLVLAAVYGIVGAIVMAFASAGTGRAIIATAAALPILILQDFGRRASFATKRGHVAFASDVSFVVLQSGVLGVLAWCGVVSATTTIIAWGVGAAAGLVVGQVGLATRLIAMPSTAALRAYWTSGRSLLSDFIVIIASRHLYLLAVAALVSRRDFGGFQAAQSLMGPIAISLQAAGNLALPRATQAYRDGGWPSLRRVARRLTIVVGSAQWGYCLVIVALGPWLVQLLYGAKYNDFATVIRVVALGQAINCCSLGGITAIKVVGGVRRLWPARTRAALVSVPIALVVASRFGIEGATWGIVVIASVELVAKVGVYLSVQPDRNVHDR